MIGQSDGKSFAYLLGVYLGDGCVTDVWHQVNEKRYKRFRLNTIDKDFAEATATAIYKLIGAVHQVNGPYKDPRFPKAAPQYQYCCTNVELCEELVSQTDGKKKLPAFIWTALREHQLAFIAGLMDSEGFVAENRNNPTNRRYFMGFKSTDLWVRDFARLLEIVGIRIGKIRDEVPRKAGYRVPTVFNIKMQSWIDAGAYFNCSRKQRRVESWAEFGPYEQRAFRPKVKTSPNEHTSGPETV